jgi:hypothetical protein
MTLTIEVKQLSKVKSKERIARLAVEVFGRHGQTTKRLHASVAGQCSSDNSSAKRNFLGMVNKRRVFNVREVLAKWKCTLTATREGTGSAKATLTLQ